MAAETCLHLPTLQRLCARKSPFQQVLGLSANGDSAASVALETPLLQCNKRCGPP